MIDKLQKTHIEILNQEAPDMDHPPIIDDYNFMQTLELAQAKRLHEGWIGNLFLADTNSAEHDEIDLLKRRNMPIESHPTSTPQAAATSAIASEGEDDELDPDEEDSDTERTAQLQPQKAPSRAAPAKNLQRNAKRSRRQ